MPGHSCVVAQRADRRTTCSGADRSACASVLLQLMMRWDHNELVDILLDRFPMLSRDTICDTLKENDWRLGPSEQALEAVMARQGSHGASSSQVRLS